MVLDLIQNDIIHIHMEDMVKLFFFGADLSNSKHANNKT